MAYKDLQYIIYMYTTLNSSHKIKLHMLKNEFIINNMVKIFKLSKTTIETIHNKNDEKRQGHYHLRLLFYNPSL